MKLSFFQLVVLATFAALAVAGVAIFAFVVGGNNTNTIGEVRIWGTLDQASFRTVMRQLDENNPGLRQVTYEQKNADTFARELTDALASGTGPELFILTQDNAEREASKIYAIPYESVSQEQFHNTFVDAAEPFLGADGVRAVPFMVDPLVLYWNRDLLATRGVSRQPTYWDELYAMSTTVTTRTDANLIEKSTIAFGEYRNINHAKDIIALLIMQAGGRMTQRDATGRVTAGLVARSGEQQQPAESAVRFYTEFSNPVRTYYTWNRARQEARTVFGSGDVALYLGLASEEPLMRRINPNLNFSIAPVPQIRDAERSINVGTTYGFAMPRANRNLQGALTVASILTSADASRLFAQAYGMASARRDVLSESAQGNQDLFNRQALIAQSWLDPDPDRTETIFRDMIESITSGSSRITEALQRAEAAMNLITQVRVSQ
jgi:ABC-type glycerol-3-phosphate transport system substrate-binding protein